MAVRLAVIITAAGSSERFNCHSKDNLKKEFASLSGHSVLYRASFPFFDYQDTVAVAVTYKKGTLEQTKEALEELITQQKVPVFFVEGGLTRQASVLNALREIDKNQGIIHADFVAIHDGARPFVTKKLISDTVEKAQHHCGAIPVIAITDTLVKCDSEGFIRNRVDRNEIFRVQTPQVFEFEKILKAHEQAFEHSECSFTDDAQVFTECGYKVCTVPGDEDNIKITFARDMK